MRRTLSLVYIGLVLPFLFSCEKEIVEPSIVAEANMATETNTASCKTYSYVTKSGTVQSYGEAWGELIMVAFKQGIPPGAKKRVLAQYKIVEGISSEMTMDYSGMQISQVQLKSGSTCFDADKLRKQLEMHSEVIFTGPAFKYQLDPWNYQKVAVSNEIMFFTNEEVTSEQLVELERETGSKVYPSEDGFYVLGTSKYSTKNVLSICTYMNTLPYIAEAVPNDIVSLPIPYEAETSSSTSSQQMSSTSWKTKFKK